ncbi:MAG TPA: hypothetical protein VN577_18155 [Terriglobales bacterium]|nr:hypothetical protein [Terriglobales bacterium]
MADATKIRSLVERALEDVLSRALPELRSQLVNRVLDSLEPEEPASAVTGESSALNAALAAIQAGATQVQILDALVDGASKFATRTALFVVRGANAVGWRARGFADDEAVRSSPLELTVGLPARAIQQHLLVTGPASEFTMDFEERFGAPVETCMVLPLTVREKVVAIVYADGGTSDHRMDRAAIEAMVRVAGLWLEVFATRKVTGAPLSESTAAMAAAAGVSPSTVSAPAPMHPLRRESDREAFQPASPSTVTAVSETQSGAVNSELAPQAAPVAVPAGEEELHKKAKRFAKLLVDEIKLYNQAKVTEGRQNSDLYERLREDIEKSRASYDKRYGNTKAKDGDYFNQELIRILADNNPALLGENFPR